jgi:hypothetical protein
MEIGQENGADCSGDRADITAIHGAFSFLVKFFTVSL